MAPSFPISLANFPALRTNKALLMIDLQNEFCGPGAALPVSMPEGYVDRALAVANAFRASGYGEVFWIRSQFDSHRPAADSRIIATDNFAMPLSSRSRNRRPPQESASSSSPSPEDGDEEAFLSVGGPDPEAKRQQVQRLLPGSANAEMSATVVAAVDTRKDIVLVKSHYSAFQSSQLLMRLRTHFVTELYICGALTNVSIHATAVDAARYGLALTLVEDCCGYRSQERQTAAVQSLVQLTGCELIDADMLIDSLPDAALAQIPPLPPRKSYGPPDGRRHERESSRNSRKPHQSHRPADSSSSSHGHSHGHSHSSIRSNTTLATGKSGSLPVRTKAPEPDREEEKAESQSRADERPQTELKPALPTAGVSPEAEPPVSAAVQSMEPVSLDRTPDALPMDDSSKKVPQKPTETPNVPTSPKTMEHTTATEAKEARPADPAEPAEPKETESTKSTETTEPTKSTTVPATEPLCEGDTLVYHNVLPPSLEENIYDRLCEEVDWQRMAHHGGEVPRLISVQGEIDDDGNMPVYRHPADESPPLESFSPTVLKIKARIEKIVGHPLNHVLIQLYRTGHDYISEHSDKTLDIVPDSYVCNVSLGAERTLIFRTKRERREEGEKGEKGEKKEEKEKKKEKKEEKKEEKKTEEKEEEKTENEEKKEKKEEKEEKKEEKEEKTEEKKEEKKEKKVEEKKEKVEKEKVEEKKEKVEEKKDEKPDEKDKPDEKAQNDPQVRRQTCRVQLPHNSLCCMGLQTNMRWLHAIRQDKRMDRDKTAAELAFGGGRISLTFRRIGTFLNRDQTLIWGQGAVGKTCEAARPVVNGQGDEAVQMLRAFGAENHSVDFGWQTHYGGGFDVLHMGDAARFFASSDVLVNLSIQLQLAELGLSYAKGSMGTTGTDDAAAAETTLAIPVRFTDSDRGNTVVDGTLAILLYLDSLYGPGKRGSLAQVETAYTFTRLQQALRLQDQWRAAQRSISSSSSSSSSTTTSLLDCLQKELAAWDKMQPGAFIAGGATASVADFAFWPVLHVLAKTHDDFAAELQRRKLYHLAQYYTNFQARENVQRVCRKS